LPWVYDMAFSNWCNAPRPGWDIGSSVAGWSCGAYSFQAALTSKDWFEEIIRVAPITPYW